MEIKVLLETECSGCKATLEAVQKVAAEQDIQVIAITDVKTILSYKVWQLPTLIIDEKVVSVGKNLNEEMARKLIEQNR